jgi:hypothetical protein
MNSTGTIIMAVDGDVTHLGVTLEHTSGIFLVPVAPTTHDWEIFWFLIDGGFMRVC